MKMTVLLNRILNVLLFIDSNLGRCNRPQKNHQKIIIIAQIQKYYIKACARFEVSQIPDMSAIQILPVQHSLQRGVKLTL